MFCVVTGFEDLGVAKVLGVAGGRATVEYFDGPIGDGCIVRKVPASLLKRYRLSENTRVYVVDPETNRWRIGRVRHDGDNSFAVRFPNRQDALVRIDRLYVRWNKPIADPTPYLGNGIAETPLFAQARAGFLRNYLSQRAAAGGMSALLSSSIELLPYQVDVVRRVLSDPVQRYLLADEVGLGKTIEAGVLIRQAVLDDPIGHRVLVLVPPGLVAQWREELVSRFGLAPYWDDTVVVLGHDRLEEIVEAVPVARMLVVDEAHHLMSASASDLYELLRRQAANFERLLLLSATPVQGNESGFLRMLHLLDPVVFPLNDEAGFIAKIQNRQPLAEAVAALFPENALQLDFVLKDLLQRLSDDHRLRQLAEPLTAVLERMPSEDDPELVDALHAVRAHLSETYRLHRRILRNRRRHVQGLTPARAGVAAWHCQTAAVDRLEQAIEEWRACAAAAVPSIRQSPIAAELSGFYWQLLKCRLESPAELVSLCRGRLSQIQKRQGAPSFEDEVKLLQRILALVKAVDFDVARAEQLVLGLNQVLVGAAKAVVFCSDTARADKLFDALKKRLPYGVVRHSISEDPEDEQEWLAFHHGLGVRVLVCDRRAEEGLNLQGGDKLVVHADAPLSPNRIEQRMGRLDRFGSGGSVHSYVLVDAGSQLEQLWWAVLDQGLGVFARSIASLQYLVEDELRKLNSAIFFEGPQVLADVCERLSGSTGLVAREFKRIDEQDGLDALAMVPEDDLDVVTDVDDAWTGIRDDFDCWIESALLFEKRTQRDSSSKSPYQPFRFQYISPGAGEATLIPLSGFIKSFLGAIDFEAPGGTAKRPLSPIYTYRRQTAIKRGLRVLRYGDPFAEGAKAFTDLDDRGRSYSLWRQASLPGEFADVDLFFSFDFRMETRLADAEAILNKAPSGAGKPNASALRRRGDSLFPPFFVRLWLNSEGVVVESALAEQWLDKRYAKELAEEGYLDMNLNQQRWEALQQTDLPWLTGWPVYCNEMRDRAFDILRNDADLLGRRFQALKRGHDQDEQRYAQLRTRIQYLDGRAAEAESMQLTFEQQLNEAIYAGIREPSIQLDAIGAVFLSRTPFAKFVAEGTDE